MDAESRKQVQDAFAAESCDVVVATVAFGMGIDRSNIRFIVHAAMPKSVEHYQQETGRAGRDGLEAECVLLYSGADYRSWEFLLQKSFEEKKADTAQLAIALKHVRDVENYCRQARCRHRALVNYFGQSYDKPNCGACDLCLGDTEPVPDALVVAQKILSCVARVKEKFGVAHVVSVLRGENTEKVRRLEHDRLSTYGLLAEVAKPELQHLIFQLISQEVLTQQDIVLATGQTVQVLNLNAASWDVMHGKRSVRLHRLVRKAEAEVRGSTAEVESWQGVDRVLFEQLRTLRRRLAEERSVPAYLIFSDKTLRELACVCPSSRERMKNLYGVGEAKLQAFGDIFLTVIADYCRANGKSFDLPLPAAPAPTPRSKSVSPTKALALELFAGRATIDLVMQKTGRARSTVTEYLCDYIRQHRPEDITQWVTNEAYEQIARAARKAGMDRLKPIFVLLEEKVPYDEVRIVVTHLLGQAATNSCADPFAPA
jgi:ATP-dependent DNA helicase RecQ